MNASEELTPVGHLVDVKVIVTFKTQVRLMWPDPNGGLAVQHAEMMAEEAVRSLVPLISTKGESWTLHHGSTKEVTVHSGAESRTDFGGHRHIMSDGSV